MSLSSKTDLQNQTCLTAPTLTLAGQVLLPHSVIPLPRARLLRYRELSSSEIPEFFFVIPSPLDGGGSLREMPAGLGTDGGIGCLAQRNPFHSEESEEEVILIKGISRGRFLRWADPAGGADLWENGFTGALVEQPRQRHTDIEAHFSRNIRRRIPATSGGVLAEVQVLPDNYDPVLEAERVWLRQQIIQRFREDSADLVLRELSGLLETELPLGHLCDLSAPALGLKFDGLCQLLGEPSVEARCRTLLRLFSPGASSQADGIPGMVLN